MQRAVLSLLMPASLALAACSSADKAPDANAERDPAAAAALNDPIMVDPDLASQNRGNSALSGGGPAQGDLPDFIRTPEEAATSRAAAQALLGAAPPTAPAPLSTSAKSRLAGALTMPALATASEIATPACADQLSFTMAWAARLPAGLPIYPRGHAIVAAGSDSAACKVRAVRYVTPVGVGDAVDFYYACTRAAKLPAERRREGSDEVVAGNQGSAAYAVYIRQRGDGMTEVDVLTSGL
jgi:hypothetical protein